MRSRNALVLAILAAVVAMPTVAKDKGPSNEVMLVTILKEGDKVPKNSDKTLYCLATKQFVNPASKKSPTVCTKNV